MLPARLLSLLALGLFVALFHSAIAALQPGYSIQILQAEHGLPQNNINSIIQSRDGYLYLGTFGGLVRFDGVRFKVFDSANTPQLQNSRITALFEDPEGVIWIGHETGDLTRLRNGQFELVNLPGTPYRDRILSITEDGQGGMGMILVYQSGTIRFAKSGVLIEPDVSPDQQRGVTASVRQNSGAFWILRAGSLSLLTGDKFQPVQFDRFAADQLVYGIGPARDEGVWIATQGRIRKRVNEKWTRELFTNWRPTYISALLEMRDGTIAVATMDQGIYLFLPNALLHVDRTDGLPPDWVRSLCEDREGNLWAAFGSGGLVALRPTRTMAVAPEDRWKGRNVLAVTATTNNTLWVGTEGTGLYRFFGGKGASVGENLTNSSIWSLTDDDVGRLWVSASDRGLYILDGERFQTPPGLEDFSDAVRVLFRSRAHNALFFGTHSGLVKYQGQIVGRFGANLVAPDIRCILEETNGVVWFGMFGGGLGKLENGKATQFRKSNGLASDFVQCLYLNPADGALWIGTAESGLTRYKDRRFASITTAHGLRDNVICHIADDGLGYLWISSHAGVMRVAKSDLNRCADGSLSSFQCLSYGDTDGLPSLQSSGGLQPTGCRTSDGLLWFATTKGIVAIDPTDIRTNQLPLVIIEQLRANDTPIATSKTEPTNIEPGRQRFEFDYTAISYAAPQGVLFKYKLDGLETDWVGPTTKRTVSYSYLPPGDYKFRLIASNSDGAWNETGAMLAFTVLPFFWQTLWFRTAAILFAVAIAGATALLIARARYHRQLELAERQRGIERERARIAQDIHDDLGSSLTRIILLSQSARSDLDSPEYAAKDLDRIYDTARNLTRSLDEIVWAVNPRHDTLDSLATYLGKFAQDFLGAANIRCRLDLPVSLPSWPLTAETRHNVFLAFKEALNNVVKHAQATEVRIALTLENSAFTITVEDNGRGFTPSSSAPSETSTEDGLANMRKRLNEVGGSCKIDSEPGKGTRLGFVVPVDSTN